MITRENLQEVVNSLSDKDKKRVLNSNKEFTVLCLHVFNAGSYVTVRLTNDYNRYKNVSNNGDAILYTGEVQDLIKRIMKTKNEKNPKNPRVGQFVYDTYYCKKRKVQAISGKLYFIGSEHEPVFRNEFIYPLPKSKK